MILTFFGVVVTNVFNGVTHNFLVVHVGTRCDLSAEKYHTSLTNSL